MKITLEIDLGKEFDLVPLWMVYDSLQDVNEFVRNKLVEEVTKSLANGQTVMNGVEVSNVIDSQLNM